RDFHEYPGTTRLLAQLGELPHGKTRILGGDQRVRLGGHIRQFGNDDFLLLEIERHCFAPNLDRGQASMRWPVRISTAPHVLRSRWRHDDAELVAVRKILTGITICAGCLPSRLRSCAARFVLHCGTGASLPRHATTCGL